MTEKEIRNKLSDIENELSSSGETADLLNDAGVGYYLLGELDEAVEFLKRAVRQEAKPEILFNLANTYSELNQPDMAISTFLEVLEIKPDHIGALNNLADEYERKGEVEKAHKLFHYTTHIQPDRALPHFNLGNFFLRQNQHIEAVKCYEEAVEKDETFVDAYHNIAWILFKAKAYSESLKYIQSGLSIDSTHEEILSLKADVLKIQEETAG